jgi:hypothetical protein
MIITNLTSYSAVGTMVPHIGEWKINFNFSVDTLTLSSNTNNSVLNVLNVGIGTPNPQATLDVSGNFKLGSAGTTIVGIQCGTLADGSEGTGTITFSNQFPAGATIRITGSVRYDGTSAISLCFNTVTNSGFKYVKRYENGIAGGTGFASQGFDWIAIAVM